MNTDKSTGFKMDRCTREQEYTQRSRYNYRPHAPILYAPDTMKQQDLETNSYRLNGESSRHLQGLPRLLPVEASSQSTPIVTLRRPSSKRDREAERYAPATRSTRTAAPPKSRPSASSRTDHYLPERTAEENSYARASHVERQKKMDILPYPSSLDGDDRNNASDSPFRRPHSHIESYRQYSQESQCPDQQGPTPQSTQWAYRPLSETRQECSLPRQVRETHSPPRPVREAHSPLRQVWQSYSPPRQARQAYSPQGQSCEAYPQQRHENPTYSPPRQAHQAYSTHSLPRQLSLQEENMYKIRQYLPTSAETLHSLSPPTEDEVMAKLSTQEHALLLKTLALLHGPSSSTPTSSFDPPSVDTPAAPVIQARQEYSTHSPPREFSPQEGDVYQTRQSSLSSSETLRSLSSPKEDEVMAKLSKQEHALLLKTLALLREPSSSTPASTFKPPPVDTPAAPIILEATNKYDTCLYVALEDCHPKFNVIQKIIGENSKNLRYLKCASDAHIEMRGEGTHIAPHKALHIYVGHSTLKGMQEGEKLASSLIGVVQKQYIVWCLKNGIENTGTLRDERKEEKEGLATKSVDPKSSQRTSSHLPPSSKSSKRSPSRSSSRHSPSKTRSTSKVKSGARSKSALRGSGSSGKSPLRRSRSKGRSPLKRSPSRRSPSRRSPSRRSPLKRSRSRSRSSLRRSRSKGRSPLKRSQSKRSPLKRSRSRSRSSLRRLRSKGRSPLRQTRFKSKSSLKRSLSKGRSPLKRSRSRSRGRQRSRILRSRSISPREGRKFIRTRSPDKVIKSCANNSSSNSPIRDCYSTYWGQARIFEAYRRLKHTQKKSHSPAHKSWSRSNHEVQRGKGTKADDKHSTKYDTEDNNDKNLKGSHRHSNRNIVNKTKSDSVKEEGSSSKLCDRDDRKKHTEVKSKSNVYSKTSETVKSNGKPPSSHAVSTPTAPEHQSKEARQPKSKVAPIPSTLTPGALGIGAEAQLKIPPAVTETKSQTDTKTTECAASACDAAKKPSVQEPNGGQSDSASSQAPVSAEALVEVQELVQSGSEVANTVLVDSGRETATVAVEIAKNAPTPEDFGFKGMEQKLTDCKEAGSSSKICDRDDRQKHDEVKSKTEANSKTSEPVKSNENLPSSHLISSPAAAEHQSKETTIPESKVASSPSSLTPGALGIDAEAQLEIPPEVDEPKSEGTAKTVESAAFACDAVKKLPEPSVQEPVGGQSDGTSSPGPVSAEGLVGVQESVQSGTEEVANPVFVDTGREAEMLVVEEIDKKTPTFKDFNFKRMVQKLTECKEEGSSSKICDRDDRQKRDEVKSKTEANSKTSEPVKSNENLPSSHLISIPAVAEHQSKEMTIPESKVASSPSFLTPGALGIDAEAQLEIPPEVEEPKSEGTAKTVECAAFACDALKKLPEPSVQEPVGGQSEGTSSQGPVSAEALVEVQESVQSGTEEVANPVFVDTGREAETLVVEIDKKTPTFKDFNFKRMEQKLTECKEEGSSSKICDRDDRQKRDEVKSKTEANSKTSEPVKSNENLPSSDLISTPAAAEHQSKETTIPESKVASSPSSLTPGALGTDAEAQLEIPPAVDEPKSQGTAKTVECAAFACDAVKKLPEPSVQEPVGGQSDGASSQGPVSAEALVEVQESVQSGAEEVADTVLVVSGREAVTLAVEIDKKAPTFEDFDFKGMEQKLMFNH